MMPLLRPGDQVLVDLSRPWACGDIVVVGSQRGLIVHRIVAMAGASVTTKGDAVERCDRAVSSTAIVGVVIRVRRRRWWGQWQEWEVCGVQAPTQTKHQSGLRGTNGER
jgi:signal peptidase I